MKPPVDHVVGHTRLAAHPTITLTGRRAIQLTLEQDGDALGFQITRELYIRLGALLEDPKDD